MKKGLIAGIIVVVVVVGIIAVFRRQPATTTSPPATASTASNNTANESVANTISYTDSGFSPTSITVAAGSTVTVKNNSSSLVQFDSDPHPQHTDDTELNAGVISPGKSVSFTVTKTGTFGYHNHLDDSQRGTITIQ